jgi:hypothetical protein
MQSTIQKTSKSPSQSEANVVFNELLAELSEEQQESVAGGSITNLPILTLASATHNQVVFSGGSTATPMMASSGINLQIANVGSSTGTYYGGYQITP